MLRIAPSLVRRAAHQQSRNLTVAAGGAEAFMAGAPKVGGGAKVPVAGVLGAATITGATALWFFSAKIVHDGQKPSEHSLNWWMSAYERNYRNDCSRLDKNTTEMIRGETTKYDIMKRKASFRDPTKDVYAHLNQPKQAAPQTQE